jgi:hypothetical protein
MRSITQRAWAFVRTCSSLVVDLLPSPPSDDAPPPGIDGRRQSEWDPEALRQFERTRKNGKGGNR